MLKTICKRLFLVGLIFPMLLGNTVQAGDNNMTRVDICKKNYKALNTVRLEYSTSPHKRTSLY